MCVEKRQSCQIILIKYRHFDNSKHRQKLSEKMFCTGKIVNLAIYIRVDQAICIQILSLITYTLKENRRKENFITLKKKFTRNSSSS